MMEPANRPEANSPSGQPPPLAPARMAALDVNLILCVLVMITAAVLRLIWLSDMEFKADELLFSNYIASLATRPFSFLGVAAGHSGVAHSSFFFYWIRFLTLGSTDPQKYGYAIAGCNAAAIVIPAFLLRRSRRGLLYLALCACSTALVVGSRKVWTADMAAPWICLSLALLHLAREHERSGDPAARSGRGRWIAIGAAGFLLQMSGHMYMTGLFCAAVGSVAVAGAYFTNPDRRPLRAWLIGCGCGWATLLPYFVSIVREHEFGRSGAFNGFSWGAFRLLSFEWLAFPSGGLVYQTYLEPFIGSFRRWHWLDVAVPNWLLQLEVLLLTVPALIWMILYGMALARAFGNWRKNLADPIVTAAAAMGIAMPVTMLASGIGSFLHYWFGAMPFAYALIAWLATTREGEDRPRRLYRVSVWAVCAISLIASGGFLLMAHWGSGIPGEYGRAYSTNLTSK